MTIRTRGAHALLWRALNNVIITLVIAVVFLQLFPGIAHAFTLVASSELERRGCVNRGLENILMQTLTFRMRSETTQLSAIKIHEYGTSAAEQTILAVDLYKESNGTGGLQTGTDTLLGKTPSTFDAEETNFVFTAPETITTSPTVIYVVYSLTQSATVGRTIGSKLSNESYLTVSLTDQVAPFTDLRSRELSIVATPHATDTNASPFSNSTNLCETCHAVHMAPDFGPEFGLTGSDSNRRILIQPYFENPAVVNAKTSDVYNALCLSCHDGTGSATNIKAQYNSVTAQYPGHETTSTGSMLSGYKQPPSGQQYDPNVKIPCMVCHDVHASRLGNYAMMADDLYEYSTENGWIDPNHNGKLDAGDETCWVCHKYTDETTRTVEIMGIDMDDVPESHKSPPKDSACLTLGCHDNPHALN